VGYRRKTRLLKKRGVRKHERDSGAKLKLSFPIEKSNLFMNI